MILAVQQALAKDSDLAYQWGFRRNARTFPAPAIIRVALYGDAEDRRHNARLVRTATRPQPVEPKQLEMAV